jgi:hypothetical protein
MIKILVVLGLTAWFASFCVEAQDAQITVPSTASPEEQYFHARDQYIDRFTKVPDSKPQVTEFGADMDKALLDLEGQLKAIIGPIQVEGFPNQGRNNIYTLTNELGFNMVDGLRYTNQNDILFVTTKALLNNYLQRNPDYPKNLNQLSETGEFGSTVNFYREVFDEDTSVTTYLELPIKRANGQTFARAFLGISSQDIGPSYIPTQIFVIAARENKIFVVSTQAKTKIEQISQCQKQSDDLWKQADEVLIAYRKSGLKNSSLFEKNTKLEEQSFTEYQHCFGREAKKAKFFAPLTSEVQTMINRLYTLNIEWLKTGVERTVAVMTNIGQNSARSSRSRVTSIRIE